MVGNCPDDHAELEYYSTQHPQLLCSLYLVNILLLGIGFPYIKSILYTWSYTYHTNSVGIIVCAMVGDPCIGQHSGHAYLVQMVRGCSLLMPTNASHTLFTFSSLTFIPEFSLIYHPPPHTHTLTSTLPGGYLCFRGYLYS